MTNAVVLKRIDENRIILIYLNRRPLLPTGYGSTETSPSTGPYELTWGKVGSFMSGKMGV